MNTSLNKKLKIWKLFNRTNSLNNYTSQVLTNIKMVFFTGAKKLCKSVADIPIEENENKTL